jgi:hypothetical protein
MQKFQPHCIVIIRFSSNIEVTNEINTHQSQYVQTTYIHTYTHTHTHSSVKYFRAPNVIRKQNSANYKYALPFFTYLLLNIQPSRDHVMKSAMMPKTVRPFIRYQERILRITDSNDSQITA